MTKRSRAMNRETVVKITAEEYVRMKAIQLDDDEPDALAMIKLLLSRIEVVERKGMKSHLDA